MNIMATNNKKTASDNKQAKAVTIRTANECVNLLEELFNKVDRAKWCATTRNGALKLTTAKPALSEDEHGTLKVGNTTYYLVSAGTSKTAVLISFRSYLVYLIQCENVARRLANFPTFEEWCAKQANDWAKFEAVGIVLSDEQKRSLYDNARAKLGDAADADADEE